MHDQSAGVTRVREFDDAEAAERAYDLMEREAGSSDGALDIVLVGSDSLDTVKQTHASYFTGQQLLA